MNIRLYINGRKMSFWFNAGWFKGDNFKISLTLLEIDSDAYGDMITIFQVQVAKLAFGFGLQDVK